MTTHETLIRLARQIASERGRDYDTKGSHKAHWRKRAESVLALQGDEEPRRSIMGSLMRACGWKV